MSTLAMADFLLRQPLSFCCRRRLKATAGGRGAACGAVADAAPDEDPGRGGGLWGRRERAGGISRACRTARAFTAGAVRGDASARAAAGPAMRCTVRARDPVTPGTSLRRKPTKSVVAGREIKEGRDGGFSLGRAECCFSLRECRSRRATVGSSCSCGSQTSSIHGLSCRGVLMCFRSFFRTG